MTGGILTDSKPNCVQTHLVHTVALPYHCTINGVLQGQEGTMRENLH